MELYKRITFSTKNSITLLISKDRLKAPNRICYSVVAPNTVQVVFDDRMNLVKSRCVEDWDIVGKGHLSGLDVDDCSIIDCITTTVVELLDVTWVIPDYTTREMMELRGCKFL